MSVAEESRVATGLSAPHHDGSELFVLEAPAELGGEAVVRVRVPRDAPVHGVMLRFTRNGEASFVGAEVDEETENEIWWRARFPVENPVTRYRWLLMTDTATKWVNGRGLVAREVPEADDFVIGPDRGGPDWHLGSVVYEIFPDRFASSGLDVDPPDWAVPRGWDEVPAQSDTRYEWFGGDLRGIEQHLDHIEGLGASVVYLTPIFPADSTHRYDAHTFDRVDPLLGGDQAFASLVGAARARGIRILGDLTTNHVGSHHEWFERAQADESSPEHDFFYFDDSLPEGYACWWGVPDLPKLDWRSPELARRMERIAQRWLEPPFDADGWRIDVANQTGRYGAIDLNYEVARGLREAVAPDKLLVAEHYHDARPDLLGGGWHGAMNYAGFMRPVWSWLGEEAPEELLTRHLVGRYPGSPVATMRAFRAGIPWSSVLHSWTLLNSHDSARFRTVAGSRERQLVGVGLQMTTPGVPMLFAGDELGLEGTFGEEARSPMPWDRRGDWDEGLLEEYRCLIALRRSSDALARGGIRNAFDGEDAFAYLRETRDERLLCLASRADHPAVRLSPAELGCRRLEPLYGDEARHENGEIVLPAGGPAFHVWRLEG